ncbi:hypothetical protein [Streptomyces djakartensis]|uniref:Fido domain-containing protein n=1 Tax=Streptomyces djakartensis TaxID=68193 RepID=A0ABQ2ZCW2_9ACTN|nr:hypothetical protein [Streptomyces djakartensis]GGY12787.1 hypothetical protein GCM10010384_17770 [Streptomyces djakartensis]
MRPIPHDLAQALEEWHTTYRQLAMQPRTELRRRLIQLSISVVFHPHWQNGNRTAAWAALHTAGRGGRS